MTSAVLLFSSAGLAQPAAQPVPEQPAEQPATAPDAAQTASNAVAAATTASGAAASTAHFAGQADRDASARALVAVTTANEMVASADASNRQAKEREQRAIDRLAQARDREERERDQALRELRVQEREFAELALAQTREHSLRRAEIAAETEDHIAELAGRKTELLDTLDSIPAEASEERRRDEVDPLFDRLLELRGEAHERFRSALDSANRAGVELDQRIQERETARTQLDRALARLNELESSQLWERRAAVARARFELAEQRVLHQREIVRAYRERVRSYHSQFGFFAGTIEPLLDRISDDRRAAYFDLGDSQNWEMALESLSTGVRALDERAEHRLEQLGSSELGSLEFLAWLWRLIWSMAGLLVLAYGAIHLLIWGLDRFCAGLLRRRLLRRKATLLVKIAEILRAVSRPTLYYVAIAYASGYAAQSMPELLGLVWIVDAVFIYWVVMQASRVAILPRSHRRAEGEVSAQELDYIDEARADNVADIIGVDLARANKLLNSIRVVTVFWLFAAYLPDFLKPLTGITVLWLLLDRAATWGVIAVVYWVLSRWRDEIAALFEQLAGERLAPAVGFVNRHKARPWGVLVIAVTSLYVLFKEIVIVVRRYALETNVFKQLNALAFRTQIELQNRTRTDAGEGAGEGGPSGPPLDPDYLELFADRPLDDEPYQMEREPELARISARFEAWQHERRRGSVAVIGEAGIGKTTLLNRVSRELEASEVEASEVEASEVEASEPEASEVEASELQLVRATFDQRLTGRDELLSFATELFELDDRPDDLTALVERVRAIEPRIVVLDDCHRCFGRHIDQFGAIDALLDLVHLTDGRHFYVLAFAHHAWRYIDRVESRGHCFGEIVELAAWSPDDLQALIERRNEESSYSASFASLVAAHVDTTEAEESFDVIETSRGYFGYLHQLSGGIPRVAMVYWLASLRASEREDVLDVDLFERPDTAVFATFSDDHWLALAALVQHGGLSPVELAAILDRPLGFCTRALDYFADEGVVSDDRSRHRLRADYWCLVRRRLHTSKFLYGGR